MFGSDKSTIRTVRQRIKSADKVRSVIGTIEPAKLCSVTRTRRPVNRYELHARTIRWLTPAADNQTISFDQPSTAEPFLATTATGVNLTSSSGWSRSSRNKTIVMPTNDLSASLQHRFSRRWIVSFVTPANHVTSHGELQTMVHVENPCPLINGVVG